MSLLLDNLSEGVFINDLNGKYHYVNKKAAEISGYTIQELLNLTAFDLSRKSEHKFLQESIQNNLQDIKGVRKVSFKLLRKDKSLLDVEVSAVKTIWQGELAQITLVKDVSDQITTEKKLSSAEIRFEEFVSLLPEIVFEIDKDLNVTYVNKAFTDKLGIKIKEITSGKINFVNLVAKSQREKFTQNISTLLKNKTNNSTTGNIYKSVPINAKEKYFQFYSNIADSGNNIIRGFAIDVTEQHILNEEIKETKDIYYNLFQNVHDAVLVLDLNENVLDCNKYALELYGFKRDKFIGHSMKNISEDKEKGNKLIKKLFGEGEINKDKSVQYNKNGKKIFVEINAKLINYKGQKAILSLNHDITKKVKQDLIQDIIFEISKESFKDIEPKQYFEFIHTQLKRIFKVENIFITLYNKESGKYKFPYFIDEFDTISDSEYFNLKNTITDLVRKNGKPLFINKYTEAKLREENNIKVIGELSPIWLGAPLYDSEANEFIGVIAIQDYKDPNAYTEEDLKTLEIIANQIGLFIDRMNYNVNLKKAKEKAEESDKFKSAFLANMSHEIRTPINGIMGFSELLSSHDVSKEDSSRFLNIINKSAKRMLATINDIIEISKIETGQINLHYNEINVIEILNTICEFFKLEAENKGLKFNFIAKDDKLLIKIDEQKFESIVSNLIKNAVKYTEQGKIQLKYSIISKNSKDYLKISVNDTGIGIPDNLKQHIFNRFNRGKLNRNNAIEGSGLGLSITKHYVELMKGEIDFKSKEGKGSEFWFILPINN